MEETQLVNPLQKAFNYAFEIQKDTIDLDERIIEGFATTEGIDREDQIVSLKAVEKALEGYMKNPTIRADHHPPPIGKTILAEPRVYKGKRGLWIKAQIGKGTQACENAWQGIRQGLYNAFSIGGIVKGIKSKFSQKAKRHIQEIDNILISEISITDAPANQECMFEVIEKSIGANDLEVNKKMTDTETETVTDFSKEFEPFSKRLEELETTQAQTSKDIAEIKELLTKQTKEEEEEEDKEMEEEEEKKKKSKKDLTILQKDLESLGFKFPEEPVRDASQTPAPPANPDDKAPSPLSLTKMLNMKYQGGNR